MSARSLDPPGQDGLVDSIGISEVLGSKGLSDGKVCYMVHMSSSVTLLERKVGSSTGNGFFLLFLLDVVSPQRDS